MQELQNSVAPYYYGLCGVFAIFWFGLFCLAVMARRGNSRGEKLEGGAFAMLCLFVIACGLASVAMGYAGYLLSNG